jgi:hypothetical protein
VAPIFAIAMRRRQRRSPSTARATFLTSLSITTSSHRASCTLQRLRAAVNAATPAVDTQRATLNDVWTESAFAPTIEGIEFRWAHQEACFVLKAIAIDAISISTTSHSARQGYAMPIRQSRRIAQIREFEKVIARKNCTDSDLESIYHEQMEFARFHNSLVWQVSTIFVPFSLAGLALNFRNESNELQEIQLLFVTAGSISFIILWCLLAEWHRWLWVHSFYLAKVVEHKWGYRGEPSPPRLREISPNAGPPSFLGVEASRIDIGRIVRLIIAVSVIFVWIARYVSEMRDAQNEAVNGFAELKLVLIVGI